MSKPLVLVGGGGHARSVMTCLPESLSLAGYVDFKESDSLAIPYIADDDNFLEEVSPMEYQVLMTVVAGRDCSLSFRRGLIERYKHFDSPVVVASDAWVADDAVVGKGTVVLHNAVVNAGSTVGSHCVVNTGAIVEHDCIIGSNVFIGPGAVICGGVEIGDNVYIGARAVVRPGIKVCADSLISLGACVFRHIRVPGTYFGNPAHKIK